MTGSTADTDLADRPEGVTASMRQFFGVTRHYPGPGIEIRFSAPAEPVRVAELQQVLRAQLPRWEDTLPDQLPAEEAVAQLARTIVANKIATWSRFRREDGIGIAALGIAVSPPFIAALLSALSRALLSGEQERVAALRQIEQLAMTLLREMAINWTAMEMGRGLGLETAWLSQRKQIYQIGMGARGKQFCQFSVDCDSLTGFSIAGGKDVTVEILSRLGLPTTNGAVVRDAAGVASAVKRIGFPCVVKPLNMGQGRGITTAIANRGQLETAIKRAAATGSPGVLIENHVEGTDHRIMVVGGRVLWAYSKVPASITGDGQSSIQTMIERENDGRNAAKTGGHTLSQPIKINDELTDFLARRYNLRLSDVLPAGQRVELAGQSNISMGGTLTDVTSDLHPDNRLLAMRVARYLRMDTLGIDFITQDISRSWKEVPCAIIEVNTLPGISGPGDAALPVRTHFPRVRSGKIPVFAAVGGSEFRAAAAKELLAATGRAGARATVIEYAADPGMPAIIGSSRPRAIEAAVLDPDIDALVLSCEPEWIEQRGFPLVHADLVLAKDVTSLDFLQETVSEITSLPPDDPALVGRVSEIVASYADEGPFRPLVTFRKNEAGGAFRLECLRFAALPREWFYRELKLPAENDKGMIGFADVFQAIERLTNSALAERGLPELVNGIEFDQPGPGWATPSVNSMLTVAPKAMDGVEQALNDVLPAINRLLTEGAD